MAVSVCMATFNGAAYIKPQLESILCQLKPEDELIVSDDGSTDATLEIVRGYDRVKVLHGPRKGIYANFNFALSHAKNEFVFLADQDDIWDPRKIASQVSLLQGPLLVLCDAVVVDRENNVLHESYFDQNWSGEGLLRNFVRNSFLGCCMAFHRSLLEAALPIPPGVAHDWWLGMLATLTGRVVFFPVGWVRYRRHAACASLAAINGRRSLAAKLSDRMRLGVALSRRRYVLMM